MRPTNRVKANINAIRKLLDQMGLSQEMFCRKAGIGRATLSRIFDGQRSDEETLISIRNAYRTRITLEELILPEPPNTSLVGRIDQADLWHPLMEAVQNVVITAGAAVMRCYSEEVAGRSYRHLTANGEWRHDVAMQAEIAALRQAHLQLSGLAAQVGARLAFLGDESQQSRDEVLNQIGDAAVNLSSPDEFFASHENTIRVIADPLDGAANHARSLPYFSSAVGLLLGAEPRVGAVMDIARNKVYTAALRGPVGRPDDGTELATSWSLTSGETVDLIDRSRRVKSQAGLSAKMPESGKRVYFQSGGVAVQMAREPPHWDTAARIGALSETFGAVYMLNAGVAAMTMVARQALVAFVHPREELHDIAAAEVLCRATAHEVTNWNGEAIRYDGTGPRSTSVAVSRKEVHNDVLALLREKVTGTSA
jgi:fructose-1,6-bisphosphatase/inositol monophosphatase family enzyme/transcriptional regulator with XRE-family HTH domain